jgi:hexosaminidase
VEQNGPVRRLCLAAFALSGVLVVSGRAQEVREPALVPRPQKVEGRPGAFSLTRESVIRTDRSTEDVGRLLADALAPSTGYALRVTTRTPKTEPDGAVSLLTDPALTRLGPEGYTLEVTPAHVAVRALTAAGVFYGTETLRQLLPPGIYARVADPTAVWTVPGVAIEDGPRFRWRGAMMDTSRHFMPKAFIEQFIDLLAMHKLNVFHWHLTDDQGWRIEIKKYPKLATIGGWRTETRLGHEGPNSGFDGMPHGGFYTQQDIREVVQYARRRFVTIVPEIEMPGHAQAAIAAYPELGNTREPVEVGTVWGVSKNIFNANEATIQFLQHVLDEVVKLFPGPFIHIGGDEAAKDQWRTSPAAQARIAALGLKDELELQSYFIGRMDAFLTKKGRRLVGWDEILEGGLAPGATVMSWRGTAGAIAAAQAGHDVVMSPTGYAYFDAYQSADTASEPLAIGGFLPLDKVYSFEPVPTALSDDQAGHVLGAQGNIWTEYIPTPEHFEYMAFPRLLALAEVVWTAKNRRDLASFLDRMDIEEQRLRALGVNFRRRTP